MTFIAPTFTALTKTLQAQGFLCLPPFTRSPVRINGRWVCEVLA